MVQLQPSDRHVTSTHTARRTLEGDGFEVRRAIPSDAFEAIGPFIFLDHFGPIVVKPGEAKGASAHPHAGIETLTLLLEGSSQHKDSLGNTSIMRPGEVQWLRAGRGVIHDEAPDENLRRNGGRVHGVQLWINMPKGHKHDAPSYRHVEANEIPFLEHGGRSASLRLIAGRVGDLTGPIATNGAPFVAHATLAAGGDFTLDPEDVDELALYVMTGSVRVGENRIDAGRLGRMSASGGGT